MPSSPSALHRGFLIMAKQIQVQLASPTLPRQQYHPVRVSRHHTHARSRNDAAANDEPGKYDADGNATTQCERCPAGSVTNTLKEAGATMCTPCVLGRYDQDLNSTTACQACVAGYYQLGNRLRVAEQLPGGIDMRE